MLRKAIFKALPQGLVFSAGELYVKKHCVAGENTLRVDFGGRSCGGWSG